MNREKFIEILAKVTECPANIIEAYMFNIDHVLKAMQSAAEAQREQMKPVNFEVVASAIDDYLSDTNGEITSDSLTQMLMQRFTICNLDEQLK